MTSSGTSVERIDHEVVGRRKAEPLDRLRQVRAQQELNELDQVDAVLSADRDGRSQRDIAAALGTSQATIHRLLSRARAEEHEALNPSSVRARRRILNFLAGNISEGTLLGELAGAEDGHFAPHEQEDGYLPGAWDEVRGAFIEGLIDERLYERIRAGLRRTK